MPDSHRIKVMISSRCRDSIELDGKTATYSELRKRIKDYIVDLQPFGGQLFECWINEDSPATEGTSDSWETCMRQVRDADILLVLYNGNPGWASEPGGVGVCHAELEEGLATGAAKVFTIQLPLAPLPADPLDIGRYAYFREYYDRQRPFVKMAANGNEALDAMPDILQEAVVELVTLGGWETRKGRFDTGNALDWSRLDFASRKRAMEKVVIDVLGDRKNSRRTEDMTIVPIGSANLLFLTHAIPAAISNAAARELVGRPFHHDYQYARYLVDGTGGPVHIFACHRGVTETQAADLLGQPDVVTVDTTFGVLAVDRASKVQCLFLRNCRDATSTRIAVQRMFDWLERSGEDRFLESRGISRAHIVMAIDNEM